MTKAMEALPIAVRMVLLLVLAAAVQAEEQMKLSEVSTLIAPFGDNCPEAPTKEQIDELLLNKEDAQMGTKCFRHCLMAQFEMMPNEGAMQLDEETSVDLISMMFPDDGDLVREIVGTCNTENTATDKCEAAHALGMCMLRELEANDFEIPKIEQD